MTDFLWSWWWLFTFVTLVSMFFFIEVASFVDTLLEGVVSDDGRGNFVMGAMIVYLLATNALPFYVCYLLSSKGNGKSGTRKQRL